MTNRVKNFRRANKENRGDDMVEFTSLWPLLRGTRVVRCTVAAQEFRQRRQAHKVNHI